MAIFISKSSEETLKFGEEYAKTLSGGDVVLLNGEMGAGKTVFAKGVAAGLGIVDEILSPCGEQAEGLGLTDYFYAGGVCLIEWAENISSVLPEKVKRVTINKIKDGRQIIYE